MFQTFSGSSRRPRQVNLSGQNLNPFAATSWTPTASGTQKTLANAQQERQQRQQERERLNASKRIQKTWRGHKARKDLADERRQLWDERIIQNGPDSKSLASLVESLPLLIAFFNPRNNNDRQRLLNLSERVSALGYRSFVSYPNVQSRLLPLSRCILQELQLFEAGSLVSLLRLLVQIIDIRRDIFPHISNQYYDFLSSLVIRQDVLDIDKQLLLQATVCPLVQHVELPDNDNVWHSAYAAFVLHFLVTPDLISTFGTLNNLAHHVNVSLLSSAIVRLFSSEMVEQITSLSRLWLLAQFICIYRLQRGNDQEPQFLRALSSALSRSSEDIIGRLDSEEAETISESQNSDPEGDINHTLPPFIRDEISSLVNQESVTGLLAKFNIDHNMVSPTEAEDASLLASYALTLLRIFPRRGDEIRMWLYLGSMTTYSGHQIPALKFFWQAMSITSTFSVISRDSKAALSLLRAQNGHRVEDEGFNQNTRDREWRTILLFLELYTFVLRFTDDEEFLSGGVSGIDEQRAPVSRIRESALPLADVKRLTLFLKNLAFTMYFNASELLQSRRKSSEGKLGNYFGTALMTGFPQQSSITRQQKDDEDSSDKHDIPFAGIAGMTFFSVRNIVTAVMRMLYERDSRRRFLPREHWLMTSRFDMEGFIPAVVMEEERRHEGREEDEEEDVDIEDESALSRNTLIGMSRPRRAIQIESMRRQQQKLARKKVLAAVGPRLEVLQNMPYVIPFETRVQIFRQFVLLDQTRRRGGHVEPDLWRMSIVQQAIAHTNDRNAGHEVLGKHHAKIRRGRVFEDAYKQFYQLGEGLKEPIQITFVDQFDTAEAGIDGGGVTKEFLTTITNEAFRSSDGPDLFITNDQNLLYPNPSALDERRILLRQAGFTESSLEWKETITDLLRQYEFLGRVVGKCLYEGILVDISFAGFFLLKWAASGQDSGYRANINDLRDLDESLYQGLLKLKNYSGDVEDFGLDFTITDTVTLPNAPTQTITRELMPNGSNIPVTNENRPLYVSYVARHRLQVQPYQQTQAFLRGLGQMINPSWLSMFNQSELQTLLSGESSEIDVEDLRKNTLYGGVYQIGDDGLEHPTVQLFWKVLKELDDSERRKLLKYVTSTPRSPLLGFSQLNPRFSIRDAGSDENRLPSTSTCVNLLKLPQYKSEAVLREKLVYAINSGAGFDLS
ncbi:hypothetical protein F5884DRAFT_877296 [Xylogone sp. PMI_703]|nr:hypothetical protein F5884DRAFT_877296 [Xylogone sp. PMI_703]